MDNLVLMKRSTKLEELSAQLGFTKTFFLEDFVLIKTENKKELLKKVNQAKKPTIFIAQSEEMLRFALEKTNVNLVLGAEKIHPKESVHFVRSGLDQVLCKIAAEKGKVIGFSFNDLLNTKDKEKLLRRMDFNVTICKKYKVGVYFGSFASSEKELRSAEDLFSFWKCLGGENKEQLSLPQIRSQND